MLESEELHAKTCAKTVFVSFILVRISGPSVSALDNRRDCYDAHSCRPCNGYPADSGATQRLSCTFDCSIFAMLEGL